MQGVALPPAGCNIYGYPGHPSTLLLLPPLRAFEAILHLNWLLKAFPSCLRRFGGLHLPAAGVALPFQGIPFVAAAGHDEDDDKKARGSPTQCMLAMAVDVLQAVQDLAVPNGESVRVRMGMHVGPAYAGWVFEDFEEQQLLGTQLQGWA